MGQADEITEEPIEVTEETEELETEEAPEQEPTDQETEAEGDKEEQPELEIVLDDEGSQPSKGKPKTGFVRRIGKLNQKIDAAQTEASEFKTKAEILEEQNKLLRLQLDTQTPATEQKGPPNPDDFDGGVHDPGYVKGFNEYLVNNSREEARKAAAEVTQQSQATASQEIGIRELRRKQEEHYERVGDLVTKTGIKDYDKLEDVAIEALGVDSMGNPNFNYIISKSDKSEMLGWYLGKNEDVAQRIGHLLKTDPVEGVLEIGRLEQRLKAKPKTNPAPNPDDEIEGAIPPSGGAMQKKVDRLRKQAQAGDKMALSKIMEIRKSAKDKGITLE